MMMTSHDLDHSEIWGSLFPEQVPIFGRHPGFGAPPMHIDDPEKQGWHRVWEGYALYLLKPEDRLLVWVAEQCLDNQVVYVVNEVEGQLITKRERHGKSWSYRIDPPRVWGYLAECGYLYVAQDNFDRTIASIRDPSPGSPRHIFITKRDD